MRVPDDATDGRWERLTVDTTRARHAAPDTATGTRPVLYGLPSGTGTPGGVFERGGALVRPGVALGDLVRRRPVEVTGHQWSTAQRTRFAYVVHPASGEPTFAVEFQDPAARLADAARTDRLTSAVCAAAGLALLRVCGAVVGTGTGRLRVIEYVLDARAYTAITARLGEPERPGERDVAALEPAGFRDIMGRLPDGRTGYVNDLGAVARAAAIEAYANRRLPDPVIRSLHVTWPDGGTQGWAWLRASEDGYLVERAEVSQAEMSCGLPPARLAEDLATAAIGEHLTTLESVPPDLVPRSVLAADLDDLRRRQAEQGCDFRFDHITVE